jgi:hypothetical protein
VVSAGAKAAVLFADGDPLDPAPHRQVDVQRRQHIETETLRRGIFITLPAKFCISTEHTEAQVDAAVMAFGDALQAAAKQWLLVPPGRWSLTGAARTMILALISPNHHRRLVPLSRALPLLGCPRERRASARSRIDSIGPIRATTGRSYASDEPDWRRGAGDAPACPREWSRPRSRDSDTPKWFWCSKGDWEVLEVLV